MASIEILGLHQWFGSFHALKGIDLRIEEGEFFSLLGPSGSGKTSLLRAIAGFEPPTEGAVRIGGEDVTFAAPEKRRLGMVFQNYALFPHLSVFENVAYGLRAQKAPRSEISDRVRQALELVDLPAFEERDVHSLSGGQQQRVALARAIAPRPRVLLMDEPLSNLDARLRQETRDQIKELQQRIGMTTVYVTHDQSEALALSDRLAILFAGRIEAMGAPENLYHSPPTEAAGTFLGDMNLFEKEILGCEGGSMGEIRLLGTEATVALNGSQSRAKVGIRPESFAPCGVHEFESVGRVQDRQFEGEVWRLVVEVDGDRVRMNHPIGFGVPAPMEGDLWRFSFSRDAVISFPMST